MPSKEIQRLELSAAPHSRAWELAMPHSVQDPGNYQEGTSCLFRTGFLCVSLAVLELTLCTRLASNLAIHLPLHPRVKGMHHHAQQEKAFNSFHMPEPQEHRGFGDQRLPSSPSHSTMQILLEPEERRIKLQLSGAELTIYSITSL